MLYTRSRIANFFLAGALVLASVVFSSLVASSASHSPETSPAMGNKSPARLGFGGQKAPAAITAAWTLTSKMNVARTLHSATLLSNGLVLVAGGYGDAGVLKSAELFDPSTNTWSLTGSLHDLHFNHTATLLPNGKVLLVGGGMGPQGVGAELYDPTSGAWTIAASPNERREDHSATLLPNGRVLIAGGLGSNGFLRSAEQYDPAGNTWSSVASLPHDVGQTHAVLLLTGKVLVLGTVFGNFDGNTIGELYNPATNSWSPAGFLNGRKDTATLLPDGRVLATGSSFSVPAASADIYDPNTNTWKSTGNMASEHNGATATLLQNGKVLIAGSFFSGTGTISAEIYDPQNGTWTVTAGLNAERSRHTATLLPSGKVLVAGGSGDFIHNTAELYDPADRPSIGPKIVFGSKRGSDHNIYVMDADGGNQVPLTNNPAYDDQPRWSADGRKIAFMSDRDGNYEIYSMNSDGSNQTRLTNNPASDGFPVWSPDGTKIAFVSGDLNNPTSFEIFVMNADGSNRLRLTNDFLIDAAPAWSPDGTKIAFMSGPNSILDPNSFEIYVMKPDGTTRTRLTNNTVADGQPAWSPDGTKILFASGDVMNPPGCEIFVMAADGSQRTQITSNSVTDGFPAWSPDGSRIIVASGNVLKGITVDLFSMKADGSDRIQLTDNLFLDWFPDWQPVAPSGVSNVKFSSGSYAVDEDAGSATINVSRNGDLTTPATVDFATSNGTASQVGDYEVASGTLTFAPGETSRTFKVLIVDDAFGDTREYLNLSLSNAVGTNIIYPEQATLLINDNDDIYNFPSPAKKQFVANLTGQEVFPPTSNVVKGNGGVVLLSADDTTAQVSLIFSGLTGSETAAHIHDQQELFSLPTTNPVTNFVISLNAFEVGDLRAGSDYMDVHSSSFSGGEIQGQLMWNPLEEAKFFVNQAYFDFLSRTPDANGLTFWTNQITQCQSDVQCLRNKRVDVSNAFFYEQEFQQSAGYVLRLYRAAYGNNQPFPNPHPDPNFPNEEKKMPSYVVFGADRARVTGGASLAQKQIDFASLFVQRIEFLNKYPASLATADQFVDAVLATLQTDLGVNLSGQRANLINVYNTQGGRSAVMYRLSDDNAAGPIANQPFIDAEYNRSFVLSQYFGYLRRNPDIPGFLFWLGQVNSAPLRNVPKQHAMVCSFITSSEFQYRFYYLVSRNNNECPQ
jgi:Tol biopolymer transport system component/N-acetylneuraminic acid mutarotase